jgi:tRNA(fMet)-specific endonuclease VapC
MLLLDTSFLVEYETELATDAVGPARRLLRSRSLEPVAISIITLGEFAEGFENIHDVEAFLSRFRMIPLSRAIAYKTAAMQAHLPQRLGENDAWIAATALAYRAELAGREQAFARVPRLKYLAI